MENTTSGYLLDSNLPSHILAPVLICMAEKNPSPASVCSYRQVTSILSTPFGHPYY